MTTVSGRRQRSISQVGKHLCRRQLTRLIAGVPEVLDIHNGKIMNDGTDKDEAVKELMRVALTST